MTESDWITLIDSDPADALTPAADWFEEVMGDEAAAVFCRWLLARQASKWVEFGDEDNGGSDKVRPRRSKSIPAWWFIPSNGSYYNPENGLPAALAAPGHPLYFDSPAAAWSWAFNAWRRAYAAGQLEAEVAWARGGQTATATANKE